MARAAGLALAGLFALSLVLGGSLAVVGGAVGSSGTVAGSSAGEATALTGGGPAVPSAWEQWDSAAAASCPGLSWSILAAIGRLESDSGRSSAPGVASGSNAAGAQGPMQFEPATFAAYATVGPGGAVPPSPYDPDAIWTAAAMLCANGGASAAGLEAAVFSYNHAADYVDEVLVLAQALLADPTVASSPAQAVTFAASKLGVPYVWGGHRAGGVRLFGTGPGRLPLGRGSAAEGGPGPVRCRSGGRNGGRPTRRPRLLRCLSPIGRTRRYLRRCG